MSYEQFWEQWCGSTARPVQRIKRGAKVRTQDDRKWITYRDEINGSQVIVGYARKRPHQIVRPGPP
jgi:hypothetical protein